jgi:uncharacterized protein (TIGR02598 family)
VGKTSFFCSLTVFADVILSFQARLWLHKPNWFWNRGLSEGPSRPGVLPVQIGQGASDSTIGLRRQSRNCQLRDFTIMHLRNRGHFYRDGFSLIEVVIATGLCTFAFLTIFSLLPVGMVTIQNATTQVTETEIFNRVWSQFNTTPYYNLQNGTTPLFTTSSSTVCYYYDQEGQDITPSGSNPAAPGTTVYTVRCSLGYSQNDQNLAGTIPTYANGTSTTSPAATFIQVQIGSHIDPANALSPSDPRVTTRTFLIAKRDTWDGS